MYGYIYKTTNLIDGLIYIGQKKSPKFLGNSYLGSGKLLRRAVKKYGQSSFRVELLEIIDCPELMDSREIYWIKHFNSTDHSIGYNISEGGFVNRTFVGENNPFYGKHHSEESRKKNSDKHKGKMAWNKGLTKDDPRVAKYAESIRKREKSPSSGTIWIHKGQESKMVSPHALSIFIEQGWILGRGPMVCTKPNNIKGRRRINNGEQEKNVLPDELVQYLDSGWQLGRLSFSEEAKYHMTREYKNNIK